MTSRYISRGSSGFDSLGAGSSHCDLHLISRTSEKRVIRVLVDLMDRLMDRLIYLKGNAGQCSYNFHLSLLIFTSASSAHTIMSDLATIRQLVKDISTLSSSLSDLVPKGSKDDKIWSVMNSVERETPHETFNYRFDALFAEDCRDSDGHLHHVRQGKFGKGLVVSYLSKINWAGFPLDIVELKLQRLLGALKQFQCVQSSFICNSSAHFDFSSGDPMYHDQSALSTLLPNSRTRTILQPLNSPSSAKP